VERDVGRTAGIRYHERKDGESGRGVCSPRR
jgi:hypothetical protein